MAPKAPKTPAPDPSVEAEHDPPPPEVRPEEFTQGTEQPIAESVFTPEVVEALREPLDPNRVRRRDGRGSAKYEYLAGHDVKRRANELFGFGNWGHRIVELKEMAAVPVANREGREGWHVGYLCVVELTVRGAIPTSGVGYGDGVEYGPASLVQSRELAIKEAETDALKRAFTSLGDQFGLILYAKDDERKRIAHSLNADETTATRVVNAPEWNAPQSWAELTERMARVLGGEQEAAAWMRQAIEAYTGKKSPADLDTAEKRASHQRLSAILHDLELAGELVLTVGAREKIANVFAVRLDGQKLDGPAWRLGPDEEDRPAREEDHAAGEAEVAA